MQIEKYAGDYCEDIIVEKRDALHLKAQAAGAFGADYVANILLQEHSRREQQPPLLLRDPRLNELATDPLSLLEYDTLILPKRSQS